MKIFEKINNAIGFTKNELRVVLILVAAFIIGSGIKVYKNSFSSENEQFDYSSMDNIFLEKSIAESTPPDLSFNAVQDERKKKNTPKLKSININKASKTELMKLPGIGEVTAERIINYREENGYFTSESDLLKVKGIGKKKLEQIKIYIVFDQDRE